MLGMGGPTESLAQRQTDMAKNRQLEESKQARQLKQQAVQIAKLEQQLRSKGAEKFGVDTGDTVKSTGGDDKKMLTELEAVRAALAEVPGEEAKVL